MEIIFITDYCFSFQKLCNQQLSHLKDFMHHFPYLLKKKFIQYNQSVDCKIKYTRKQLTFILNCKEKKRAIDFIFYNNQNNANFR